jgi:transcriptional regulator with XRE-family HTH domain
VTNSEYGQRLRDLRAELRLSLREVEERGGPSKDVLSPIERGVHKPRAQTLGKIAQAFGMSVPELRARLEDDGPKAGSRLPSPQEISEMGYPKFRELAWNLDSEDIQELRVSLLREATRHHGKKWEEFAQLEFILGLMLQVRDGAVSADAIPKELAVV